MDDINKKELSEIDICDLFITPAIKDAGWDQMLQINLANAMIKQAIIPEVKK